MRAARQHDRTGMSVRSRLLITMLVLMAAALLAAGATGYLLERIALERAASAQLDREAGEFASLAANAVDPATGRPFESTSALLEAAIQQRVLGQADGVLGIVANKIEWTAYTGVELRLEDDPALVAEVTKHISAQVTTQGRLRSGDHDYLYLVMPVRAGGVGGSALVRATDLNVAYRALDATYAWYAVAAAIVALFAGLTAWAVMGRLLAPIVRLREAADSIGEDDLTTRIPVRGHDDLSALTATINRMLDRIESLVQGQRQLADDVGHELRTPLTILRGHLELLDPTDVDQVKATRSLALEEIDRMNRLTDDLILLASSERADFVVAAPISVADLTDETFELVGKLGHRRWDVDALAEVKVQLDAQRIKQAWIQLADNAVKYSPADSSLAIGSEVRGSEVWLWVRDNGPGIATAERSRILERNARGHLAIASGSQGRGLGLAIVTKIVTAHGGRLDIASAPEGGSIFSLVLPITDSKDQVG
jgi:two-component system, OmpR family, sensor kinase